MKDTCVIKSNANGLTLVLDRSVEFEKLVRDICEKFAHSRRFFGDSDIILSISGRTLTDFELSVVVEAVELNSDVNIVMIEDEDRLRDKRMAQMADQFYFDEIDKNAKIYADSVRRGKHISSDSSLLILGDVRRGGSVSARANVIIMGDCAGRVEAGIDGNVKAYVVAGSISSEDITISGISGEIQVKNRWLFRPMREGIPQGVIVWEGGLLQEPVSSGILNR